MLNDEFKAWLQHRFPGRVKLDEPMSRHTSFCVGGPAEVLVSVKGEAQLTDLVMSCEDVGIEFTAVAGGTNLLVRDGGIPGVVINMKKGFKETAVVADDDGQIGIMAQAGVNLQTLCRQAIENGYAGMNFALGIPGTVGGAVIMNAGTAKGAMADIVESIRTMGPDGRPVEWDRSELEFGYRHFSFKAGASGKNQVLVTGAKLSCRQGDPKQLREEAREILNERMRNHPVGVQSSGCFFKNPDQGDPAGKLIDRAGLKGRRVGGALVSEKHANYIVNTGSATAADILALAAIVQEQVAEKFDIRLEPEVKIVGE